MQDMRLKTGGASGGRDPVGFQDVERTVVREVSDIAFDLVEAAKVVESSAISLAGEVAGGQVTHLMLLSQQLERISKSLVKPG
ncbi:hypothetical protein TRP8649_04734 [Pelagimonas phthalicica]|uniref:Uncharacterized protein n=2 Tax=Rhodobacterales TaxID=204455 RepID=A0A238JIT6_9RHOB|nr:hypothetical protein CLV87_4813 [Pelagimonas phthalicica]SMX30590.1 hypothetical protein TRP8649_04734 [Pelagimonas phthalicica]